MIFFYSFHVGILGSCLYGVRAQLTEVAHQACNSLYRSSIDWPAHSLHVLLMSDFFIL